MNQSTVITLMACAHTDMQIGTDTESGMLAMQGLSAVRRLQVLSTYYQGGAETET